MSVSGSVDQEALLSAVERIEHVQTQIDGLNDDKREIYQGCKAKGLDPKVVKQVVARRAKDADALAAEEDKLAEYLHALDLAIEERNKREVIKTPIPATPKPRVQAHARAKSSAGFETAGGAPQPGAGEGEEGAAVRAEDAAPRRTAAPSDPDERTSAPSPTPEVGSAEGVDDREAEPLERRAAVVPGSSTPTPDTTSLPDADPPAAQVEAEGAGSSGLTGPSGQPAFTPSPAAQPAPPASENSTALSSSPEVAGAVCEGAVRPLPSNVGGRLPRQPRRPRTVPIPPRTGSDRESVAGATDGPAAAAAVRGNQGGGAADGRAPANDFPPTSAELRREAAE